MSTNQNKKVLVYGSGGREHAIAWKLSQSHYVSEVVLCPGGAFLRNSQLKSSVKLSFWDSNLDFEELAKKACDERIDLAVIGPDNPIADGICDVLRENGITTFGPSKKAAQIEASKSFAKHIMNLAQVPTGAYEEFEDASQAKESLANFKPPYVVKADGLAFGKGVIISETLDQAKESIDELIQLSGKIIIEEFLKGEELSWMAFCSDEDCVLLDSARDYKRLLDGQKGPNTGGMGSYSPVSEVNEDHFFERVRNEIFLPVLKAMKKEGCSFQGLLYAGLMFDKENDRINVLEFNARFGDPETQALLPRMQDDLYLWMEKTAKNELSDAPSRVQFSQESSVFVVGAAPGYPVKPIKGAKIEGLIDFKDFFDPNLRIFCAGVNEAFEVSGGRVLGSLGLSKSLGQARKEAYEGIRSVAFEGMQTRGDIAK